MSTLDLVRPDLRGFAGYRSARSDIARGEVWLNANESPWPNPADPAGTCRRYPEPQPTRLREVISALYGCAPECLLLSRGSDEAIDLLVRALCRPGEDAVLVTPPVFGMYAVSARLQGARLVEVPLRDAEVGFELDADAVVAEALQSQARIVFLCSPSNPTGGLVPLDAIEDIAARLDGRALVVVDEAYGEYTAQASATTLLPRLGNLAVLRTLSKAHALAAARVGCVIADAVLVAVLRACQAPYPVPAPCAELA
ncbi:MAG TPA: aminotransferase class I/II-fold pyridoxal phosphate-dependent enzyme, partial [Luteimonas sp.]